MERVLITGIDGVVGGNLAVSLNGQFEVVGTTREAPVELAGCSSRWCGGSGVADEAAVAAQESPLWIIHAGLLAISSWETDRLEEVTDKEWADETRLVERLASYAQKSGCHLTVIGSDAVFAGPGLFHEESALRCGRGALAEAARSVEDTLRNSGALVVRTNAYGFSPTAAHVDFSERAWQALTDGESPLAWTEPHATPILATDLAHLLVLARRRGVQGVLHLCGAERTSHARFVTELAAAIGPPASAERQRRHDTTAAPQETSLDTRFARRELGVALPLLREGIGRLVEQASSGWRSRLPVASALQEQAA